MGGLPYLGFLRHEIYDLTSLVIKNHSNFGDHKQNRTVCLICIAIVILCGNMVSNKSFGIYNHNLAD